MRNRKMTYFRSHKLVIGKRLISVFRFSTAEIGKQTMK